MASYTFENHTFRMVDRTDGKDIKVPSNMYPLNREAQLFTTETTDTISDAHVREIVNCIDGRMNNTYQNAEQVVRTLNVYGIPAVQYVGWVFMSDSAPMYQSFALVKGDHGGPAIIDLSVDPIWPQWEQEMAQYTTLTRCAPPLLKSSQSAGMCQTPSAACLARYRIIWCMLPACAPPTRA